MAKHDSLSGHDTGPSEFETQVEEVTEATKADGLKLLIAAHIEQDTANAAIKALGPLFRGLVERIIAAA